MHGVDPRHGPRCGCRAGSHLARSLRPTLRWARRVATWLVAEEARPTQHRARRSSEPSARARLLARPQRGVDGLREGDTGFEWPATGAPDRACRAGRPLAQAGDDARGRRLPAGDGAQRRARRRPAGGEARATGRHPRAAPPARPAGRAGLRNGLRALRGLRPPRSGAALPVRSEPSSAVRRATTFCTFRTSTRHHSGVPGVQPWRPSWRTSRSLAPPSHAAAR